MFCPPPSYAVTLWLNGDNLMVAIPPAEGHTYGHTIPIPNTPSGLAYLAQLLAQHSTAKRPGRLMEPGVPTSVLAQSLSHPQPIPKYTTRGKLKPLTKNDLSDIEL